MNTVSISGSDNTGWCTAPRHGGTYVKTIPARGVWHCPTCRWLRGSPTPNAKAVCPVSLYQAA